MYMFLDTPANNLDVGMSRNIYIQFGVRLDPLLPDERLRSTAANAC